MDLEAIRQFVHEHPDGITIRMIDGRKYTIPHRDYVFFGPPRDTPEGRKGVHRTSFILYEPPQLTMRLVNALLVAEVLPLPAKRNGHGRHRSKK